MSNSPFISGTPQKSPVAIESVEALEVMPAQDLKNIQRNNLTITTEGQEVFNYSISWDPADQSFSAEKEGCCQLFEESISPLPVARIFSPRAARIAEILNSRKHEFQLRIPAENYPLQAGVLEELLFESISETSTLGGPTATIVHSGGENIYPLRMTSSAPTIRDLDASDSRAQESPVIFLYGTNRSRSAMEKKLVEKTSLSSLAKLETIDDYNECIDILSTDYDTTSYFYFLLDGREKKLENSINYLKIRTKAAHYPSEASPQQKTNWLSDRIRHWVKYLENNINEFGFTRKCEDSAWINFVIKNTNLSFISPTSKFQELLRPPLEDEKLERLKIALEPLREILSLTDKTISEGDVTPLTKYHALPSDEKDLLDTIISIAFFRKTSKLGLEFAHDHGIGVLVDYNLRGASDLNEFHELLDARPYKRKAPEFESNGFHKFITKSELHHLERLKIKNEAPHHLLIRKIA